MSSVKAIPDGFRSLTPHIVVKGCAQAVEFYQRAFGAKTLVSMPGPGGAIMHAEVLIGDSILMLADEFPDWGSLGPDTSRNQPVTLHLYTEDVEACWEQAVAAGCTVKFPLQDMFWGDRYGKLQDPFGHEWGLAQHTKDLTPEEMAAAAQAAMGDCS